MCTHVELNHPALTLRCNAFQSQSLLFKQTGVGFYDQVKMFWRHTKRISS
jgi:hypothetical protein